MAAKTNIEAMYRRIRPGQSKTNPLRAFHGDSHFRHPLGKTSALKAQDKPGPNCGQSGPCAGHKLVGGGSFLPQVQ